MFRDYKSGGYYLEATGLKGQRVMALTLLIALAYSSAVMREHLTFAAKLEIGVRSQESGARRKEEEGRRKEPEEVFLQI
jgi:hypothetical protein